MKACCFGIGRVTIIFFGKNRLLSRMVRITYPSALPVSEMVVAKVTPQFVLSFDVCLQLESLIICILLYPITTKVG
jgi:hypothetical protein